MSHHQSIMRRLCRVIAATSALPLAVLALPLMSAPAARAAGAAGATTFYASPSAGSGTACTQAAPCTLPGAQAAVRSFLKSNRGADVTVLLEDGTYRLSSTWAFTAADSGSAGHPVVWQAAPGAHPVISGASQIGGWSQVGTSAVWSATVPAGSNSRQLYVNGQEAPVAQATPSSLGWSGGWGGSPSGYTIGGDAGAMAWFKGLTPAQVSAVEFDYPGGNGAWAESRCRVAGFSASAGTLTMDQPCWSDVTDRASFSQGSGGLPSMSTSRMPSLIENARALLHPGQWFLDSASTPNTLYYVPPSGAMTGLDVELPHLESLLTGSGTLAAPIHDLTFSGLQFSYATWNDPSTSVGFADVQSNLRMTGATNQGMCTFSNPAGSCPWGALSQPLANVAFSGAVDIALRGNRFSELGGAGLSVMYGSTNTVIDGNEFTDIASTAILLGCAYDPNPLDPSQAAGIKAHCTTNPSAVGGDSVGANEILTGTTVSNNVIHRIGTDYSSACGITLLFSQHTTISHNDLYDLPYTGITAGVIQGHVDQYSQDPNNPGNPEPPSSQNSTNINEYNTVSDNLIHDYLTQRQDGGAIYVEGHQAQYVHNSDGTLNSSATLATGLQATGNVAYNGATSSNTYYDDAGSEWINWQGNAAFATGGISSQGGCNPTGHFWITGNYFAGATQAYNGCNPSVTDSNASGNTTIPNALGPGVIPDNLLSAAGSTTTSDWPAAVRTPRIYYRGQNSAATQALVGGEGFSNGMPVYVKGSLAGGVTYLSGGFLLVPLSGGAQAADITLDGSQPGATRVNDTDPSIAYSGFSYLANRGYGDFDDDVHYATANGSTTSYQFTGTGIQVFGEQYTDQGNIGVSIDGGAQHSVNTVPADDQRHANVAVFTATGLSSGTHTVTVTKLSGTYSTLDGFAALNPVRANDTDPSIAYSGFSYSANRGYGDFDDDVHYATADGSTASYQFTGTGIQVFGEQYTDQGNIGVSIDGGAQQSVNTVPTDGQRHTNVPVFSSATLTAGTHTVVITKLSGTYATLDGFGIVN
ncbi:hypothetical protein [Catenulispora pinisilvae]|uniref:hypothetical protein n=1 Tax=Catenulispora pinisilvae TaxID=2705253 RepID=UPI0018920A12|nr:hypothetical protein [Catenulispora pinisilvae]